MVINKEDLIKYILENDPKAMKENLEQLSLAALVMLKVQIELLEMKKEKQSE
jgi:hypothetical protein